MFKAHLEDLAERAQRSHMTTYTRFLNEKQLYIAEKIFQNRTDCNVSFWGGHNNAVRKICCFNDEWTEHDNDSVPIVCITYRYRENAGITHRDFLGAFMSCGIERETVGDIIVGTDITQAFATEAAAPLLREITKIGNCGVKVSDDELFSMQVKDNFREISGTVSSLRIDSVAALGIKESREKTVRLIQQGKVELNYTEITSSSSKVSEGDIFVVRGFGKFRLKEVTGLSKKGRLHIMIEQFK